MNTDSVRRPTICLQQAHIGVSQSKGRGQRGLRSRSRAAVSHASSPSRRLESWDLFYGVSLLFGRAFYGSWGFGRWCSFSMIAQLPWCESPCQAFAGSAQTRTTQRGDEIWCGGAELRSVWLQNPKQYFTIWWHSQENDEHVLSKTHVATQQSTRREAWVGVMWERTGQWGWGGGSGGQRGVKRPGCSSQTFQASLHRPLGVKGAQSPPLASGRQTELPPSSVVS